MCRYYPALPVYKGKSFHIINDNTKWFASAPTCKCT